MELLLYIIRIAFILLIFLFIQNIINTIQKDIEAAPSSRDESDKTVRLRLEVIKGSDKIKLIKKDLDALLEITLGREMHNDIVVVDKYISGAHLKIKKLNEVYYIEDLDSTNGTFVNNKLVAKSLRLKDQDIINLGDVQIRVSIY
ncbi:MAG: FHA domain-containing protein [Armatimonadota bacterium]